MAPDPLQWETHPQRAEVRVDYKEIGELFLDRLDDLVAVRFCKPFEGGFADNVAKIDVIFAIFGFSKLVDQKLNRGG